jgi:hypothetical protein
MDITACPQPGCAHPAEMLGRAVLESTDGPVEHARLLCLNGHRFFMPTMMLSEQLPTPSISASDAVFRRVAR